MNTGRPTDPSTARRPAGLDQLLRAPSLEPLIDRFGLLQVRETARDMLAEARSQAPDFPDWSLHAEGFAVALGKALGPAPRPLARVHNLTGTVVHTNLGRAPMPEAAVAALVDAARHPLALEYDLGSGRRGHRDGAVEDLIRELTGAEAATVVNNCAAAVLLLLGALAAGREVVVSRGELIEIGGAFRLPDIMAQAGCVLREVGTTNRTHARDYAGAIGDGTALLMKAHPSNYLISGFTAEVGYDELAALGHEHGVPVAFDLGSGALIDFGRHGMPGEPTVRAVLDAGVDVVAFSGDKLLGGPQAGIIAGRRELIESIRTHPLKRALRPDKLTLAALRAVLGLYLEPDRLRERLPLLRQLTRAPEAIATACAALDAAFPAALRTVFDVQPLALDSQFGSGALPGRRLPSAGLALRCRDGGEAAVRALADLLRQAPVPVLGRLRDGALLLDGRCLEDPREVAAQFAWAIERLQP